MMTSSDTVCEKSSKTEELSVYEEPPTHKRAAQCVQELERHAFAHNQPEMVETLFGLRRKLETEWTSSKIKSKTAVSCDGLFLQEISETISWS
jgi:hypothetical protein